jgi:hypothetical protein
MGGSTVDTVCRYDNDMNLLPMPSKRPLLDAKPGDLRDGIVALGPGLRPSARPRVTRAGMMDRMVGAAWTGVVLG